MRLEAIKNTPRIVFYLGLVGLLLLLLAVSGKINDPISNKKIVDSKTGSVQSQTLEEVESDEGSNGEDQESLSANSNTPSSFSTSTKIHISVNSSSTKNKTTGSFKLNIDGNENDFSTALDECLAKGEVEIDEDGSEIECELDEDGLKIDFDIDSKHKSTSKTSIETSVDTKNESD